MDRRSFIGMMGKAGLLPAYQGFASAKSMPSTNDVVFLSPGDADYLTYATLFNKRIIRRPKIIAVCFNERGVQQAVHRARELQLPVAIKSGGHSFEGFSHNDGGFTIDLASMHAQYLSEDGHYIVEPSCRLMQMYEYLLPRKRLIPAGSCGMVGIAGLTLGGGYGLFSRQHGLTCDSLRRLRLVDAHGEVHDAIPGSDLFWACRGGGNGHFGVVTHLEFETFSAPRELWRHLFRAEKLTHKRVFEIAQVWFAVARDLPDEAFSAFVLNHKVLTILVTSTLDEIDARLARALTEIEKVMDKRYPDLHEANLLGVRRYYGKLAPLYFKNSSAGYYRGFDDIRPIAQEIFEQVLSTRELLYQINTLGGAISRPLMKEAGCYTHREYPFLGEIQSYWDHPRQEHHAHAAVRRVLRLLQEAGVSAHYVNYPDLSIEGWERAYYGDTNYRRLQMIKKRYDPDNLFSYAQSVRA